MKIRERMQAVIAAEAEAIAAVQITDEFVEAVRVLEACSGKVLDHRHRQGRPHRQEVRRDVVLDSDARRLHSPRRSRPR